MTSIRLFVSCRLCCLTDVLTAVKQMSSTGDCGQILWCLCAGYTPISNFHMLIDHTNICMSWQDDVNIRFFFHISVSPAFKT